MAPKADSDSIFDRKSILVTGGTGSFGQGIVSRLLEDTRANRVIVFSRDELKQSEMEEIYRREARLRFVLGDIRDRDRLHRAFDGVDVVIHAAALKRTPAAEVNPFEFVKTNILGAQNVIDAAIERKVKRVVALSTDKASSPVNLYGATKLVADRLFVAGNAEAGEDGPCFAVVRYGNVIGSRGSVIPLLRKLGKQDRFRLTDGRMTRFWITPEHAERFVLQAAREMVGGEIFVPKIPSMTLEELVKAVAPEIQVEIIGMRPGEKLHEEMISSDEARRTVDRGDHYVIRPDIDWPGQKKIEGEPVPRGFRYSSEDNPDWLHREQLMSLLDS